LIRPLRHGWLGTERHDSGGFLVYSLRIPA
jgi:hypothetical protein